MKSPEQLKGAIRNIAEKKGDNDPLSMCAIIAYVSCVG